MHTGRMSCHCTKKGVNYYVNNNHAWMNEIFIKNSQTAVVRVLGYFPQTLRPIVYALQKNDRNFA